VRCAVLGSPIAHSLSPALHRAAYAVLGLDWTYDAVEVESDGLDGFLDSLDDTWRGLSLTMPLKRTVVPLAGTLDHWTRLSGVANTLVLDDQRRLAFNTDIPGALAALSERDVVDVGSAVVLGGGATATSVLLALAEMGCDSARLLVRDPARAEETLAAVTAHPAAPEVTVGPLEDAQSYDAEILVSTIPAAAQTEAVVRAADGVPAVFEVVYAPWPTPLARAASGSGRVLVSGLDLLAHQAALQVRLMTGKDVLVHVIREAGRAELARRGVPNGGAGG
jgi:shikimate dehydrogenase